MSEEMGCLLNQILWDPSSSKLGALLKQNKQLLSSLTPRFPTLQANIDELNRYEVLFSERSLLHCQTSGIVGILYISTQAHRMLQVSENHLELLNKFPSHFRFVILQHSLDR